jgi:hypothetical protein
MHTKAFVYLLMSLKDFPFSYVGQTIKHSAKRIEQHHTTLGAASKAANCTMWTRHCIAGFDEMKSNDRKYAQNKLIQKETFSSGMCRVLSNAH